MSLHIVVKCETRIEGSNEWVHVHENERPFDSANQTHIGAFLASVGNWMNLPVLSPVRGLPEDVSEGVRTESRHFSTDFMSPSWLSVAELVEFDYDAHIVENLVKKVPMIRKSMSYGSEITGGTKIVNAGEGEKQTLRALLGPGFFNTVERLKELKVERIVFWFDNRFE